MKDRICDIMTDGKITTRRKSAVTEREKNIIFLYAEFLSQQGKGMQLWVDQQWHR